MQTLEVLTHNEFFGHADAAMELNRLRSDKMSRTSDAGLGGRGQHPALLAVQHINSGSSPIDHGPRHFKFDIHVDQAMAQHLELTEIRTKLLARRQVISRGPE